MSTEENEPTFAMDQVTRPDLVSPPRIEEPQEVAPEPEATGEPQAGPERDAQGRFKAKQDETGEKEPQPEPPSEQQTHVPLKALEDERRKRQEMEQELAAIRQQMQQFQQQRQPEVEPPSIWEDDRAALAHERQITLQQADQLSRINASEMAARSQYPDFQEHFDLFNQIAVQNPAVVQQAMSDPHPWGRAYQIAKSYRTMQEMGATNLDELRARITEEVRAEIAAQAPSVPNFPKSTVQDGNAGPRGMDWANYRSGEPILPMDRR